MFFFLAAKLVLVILEWTLEDNSKLVTLIPSEDLTSFSTITVLHQQFLRSMLDNVPMFFLSVGCLGLR